MNPFLFAFFRVSWGGGPCRQQRVDGHCILNSDLTNHRIMSNVSVWFLLGYLFLKSWGGGGGCRELMATYFNFRLSNRVKAFLFVFVVVVVSLLLLRYASCP